MAKQEYKARIKNGVLEIFPHIIKKTNANGGTDIIVCVPSLTKMGAYKQEILNKLAAGIPIPELEIENE